MEFLVETDIEQQQETSTGLPIPKRYKVILLNDDYTPMDFVVNLLKRFFYCTEQQATELMLAVHFSGQAVCGIYTRDVAETKVSLVNQYARSHEHPLLCCMEEE